MAASRRTALSGLESNARRMSLAATASHRGSIGGAGSRAPPNPYLEDAAEYAKRIHSSSIKERSRAIVEIGQLAYLGDDAVQAYILQEGTVDDLVAIVKGVHEPVAVKMKAIQALSLCCRKHRATQDQLRKLGYIEYLANLLSDGYEEMRKWGALSLFFLLHGNSANQAIALTMDGLKERLFAVSNDNWEVWTYNDAEEVMKMLQLNE